MHLRAQRGSFMGWFLVIVAVLGVASMVIRFVPHYIDHRTIRGVIQDMVEDDRIARSNANEFRRTLGQRLQMNNIREFDIPEAVTVEARAGDLTVELAYEVREPLFGNADIVLTFEERFERVLR